LLPPFYLFSRTITLPLGAQRYYIKFASRVTNSRRGPDFAPLLRTGRAASWLVGGRACVRIPQSLILSVVMSITSRVYREAFSRPKRALPLLLPAGNGFSPWCTGGFPRWLRGFYSGAECCRRGPRRQRP
jgi:hypothetical protein